MALYYIPMILPFKGAMMLRPNVPPIDVAGTRHSFAMLSSLRVNLSEPRWGCVGVRGAPGCGGWLADRADDCLRFGETVCGTQGGCHSHQPSLIAVFWENRGTCKLICWEKHNEVDG